MVRGFQQAHPPGGRCDPRCCQQSALCPSGALRTFSGHELGAVPVGRQQQAAPSCASFPSVTRSRWPELCARLLISSITFVACTALASALRSDFLTEVG